MKNLYSPGELILYRNQVHATKVCLLTPLIKKKKQVK